MVFPGLAQYAVAVRFPAIGTMTQIGLCRVDEATHHSDSNF
jgi:hypothetical protein